MRKLILIKHAAVDPTEGVPPEKWHLSEKGRESCRRLADSLAVHLPFKLLCSEETKASETAAEIAKDLQITFQSAADLEEHDRSNEPLMRTSEFISMMELFFRKPNELVLGRETAEGALSRFRSAVDEAITENAEGNLAIVTHGTVIALFMAHHGAGAGFALWRKMG